MAVLPLTPQIKPYRGAKDHLRQQWSERYARAQRICDHVNRLIASDPRETQTYLFDTIAIDLNTSRDEVWDALSDGGSNGITVGVTEDDRVLMARYRTIP